jgi:2-oxoglutarate dehydrogenase E2 component (dihydrolipoamide succinyltransferase)
MDSVATAPKEESKPKDVTEPADQQVDKSLPEESTPSATDKVAETPTQVKDKAVEKTAAPKREQRSQQETPRTAAGSRGETRVDSYSFSWSKLLILVYPGENEQDASSYR